MSEVPLYVEILIGCSQAPKVKDMATWKGCRVLGGGCF